MDSTLAQQVNSTVQITEGFVLLPGVAEQPLTEWSLEVAGGRADDALVHLRSVNGVYLGYLTLGWFRQNTTLSLMERAAREVLEDDDNE